MQKYTQKSCFCSSCTVRTGTIIVAVIWLVVNIVNASVYAWHLLHVWTGQEDGLDAFFSRIHGEQLSPDISKVIMTSIYKNHGSTTIVVLAFLLIGAVTNSTLSALMAYAGIRNGPRRFLAPWFYFNLCGAIVSAIWSILVTICLLSKFGSDQLVNVILLLVLISAGHAYVFQVVHQYNQQLKKQERKLARQLSTISAMSTASTKCEIEKVKHLLKEDVAFENSTDSVSLA